MPQVLSENSVVVPFKASASVEPVLTCCGQGQPKAGDVALSENREHQMGQIAQIIFLIEIDMNFSTP